MAYCIGECEKGVFFYGGGWYLKAFSPLLLREHYKYLEHRECKLNGLCVGTACKEKTVVCQTVLKRQNASEAL